MQKYQFYSQFSTEHLIMCLVYVSCLQFRSHLLDSQSFILMCYQKHWKKLCRPDPKVLKDIVLLFFAQCRYS